MPARVLIGALLVVSLDDHDDKDAPGEVCAGEGDAALHVHGLSHGEESVKSLRTYQNGQTGHGLPFLEIIFVVALRDNNIILHSSNKFLPTNGCPQPDEPRGAIQETQYLPHALKQDVCVEVVDRAGEVLHGEGHATGVAGSQLEEGHI